MSVLTNINGIPLFSTLEEALAWASANSLVGYHTHVYSGQTGYMGGVNHTTAINTTSTPTTRTTRTTTRNTTRNTSIRSSNSSY